MPNSSDDEGDEDQEGNNSVQSLKENLSEPSTLDSLKSVSGASTSRRSTTLMKRKRADVEQSPMQEYLQFKREQQKLHQQDQHPLDIFFSSMAATVKTYPAPVQLDIKQKVFQLVTEAEAKIINASPSENVATLPSEYAAPSATSSANKCDLRYCSTFRICCVRKPIAKS